jgi:hypothetical protein
LLLGWVGKDFDAYQKHVREVWESPVKELCLEPRRVGNIPGRLLSAYLGDFVPVELRERSSEFQHYGHDFLFKRFLGLPYHAPMNITAEHAVFLGLDDNQVKRHNNKERLVFTMSERREIFLRQHGLNAQAVGPYINYAVLPISAEKLEKIKSELGRIMVYFPMHSTERDEVRFDVKTASDSLRSLSETLSIDTLVICYYWHDLINQSLDKQYKDIPHIPACCGHRNNPFFLDHMRLLLEVADFTCSNNVGTAAGYSVFLNKPHFIFSAGRAQVAHLGKHPSLYTETIRSFIADKLKVYPAQGLRNVVDHQRICLSDYWGFNSCMQRADMLECICG